jgi:hypothetical protein
MYRSRTPAAAIHRSFAHGGSMSTRQIKAHLEVMFAAETDHGAPVRKRGFSARKPAQRG